MRGISSQQRNQLIATLKSTDPLQRLILLRDPWIFLATCVYSSDEKSDTDQTIKPAPVDKDYIAHLVRQWILEDLIILVKSRQLWCSWLYTSLCLHHVMTKTDQQVFFVSEKAEKADALITRARDIYDRIPEDIWPLELRPKMVRVENHMRFNEIGSAIHALPSGKDQMRGFTASIVFDDEAGFWADAEETIAAQIPAAKKIVVVSTIPESFTAEPTFYWKLVYDAIDYSEK